MKKFVLKRQTTEMVCESMINEAGGVAASPWKKEIKRIVGFIKLKKDKNPKLKKLVIPQELVECFHFIGHFIITVYFENVEQITQTVYGDCNGFRFREPILDWAHENGINIDSKKELSYYFSIRDESGKINHAKMNLRVQYDGKEFSTRGVSGTLYHEINHLYHMWMSVYPKTEHRDDLTYDQKERIKLSADFAAPYKKSVFVLNYHYDVKPDECVDNLLYRLFSDTELNACVASVYGELTDINSKKCNWKKDLHNTQGYRIYVK